MQMCAFKSYFLLFIQILMTIRTLELEELYASLYVVTFFKIKII